ncbi:MAG: ribE [Pseudonocardiales bacterium]|nr:ribE [Jatrophihabitantaceae bacterium]MCW2602357.1 ribE [Pseudonocardiales bacterium]
MFTGIVEELGEVVAVDFAGGATDAQSADAAVITVRCAVAAEDVSHGASIAVNGVCLTVIADEPSGDPSHTGRELRFDVMGVTLRYSSVGDLVAGSVVNLERAMPAHGRLDGHIVQGHVDGTGSVISRTPGTGWDTLRFALPADIARFVARKGSVAVDGVSLTVAELGMDEGGDWFEVGLIPETLRATNLGRLAAGSRVNLEVDVLAKYTERLLAARAGETATN